MEDESPLFDTYLHEIAHFVAGGDEPEAISRKMNLEVSFILKCLADPKFDDLLERINPQAYKEFKQARLAEQIEARVLTLAKKHAVDNFRELQDLVDGGTLDPKDEAAYRLKLIQIAGVVGKEQETEIVKLAPAQVAIFHTALEETK